MLTPLLLLQGLWFIHGSNVCHFDLKPANIFITAAGRFKIGDFGMASFWPRPVSPIHPSASSTLRSAGFDREGDKMYLAAEVLQGRYGKEADIFSFGMIMLETATNIVVPAQGELWHKLREEDFSAVGDLDDCSEVMAQLIMSMMSKDPSRRPSAEVVHTHPVINRARAKMVEAETRLREEAGTEPTPDVLFKASPLAGVEAGFLEDILGNLGADAVMN